MQDSLADRFIDTMAQIRELNDLCDNQEPMRHEIRALKSAAEDILSHAINEAGRIASIAKDLPKSAISKNN